MNLEQIQKEREKSLKAELPAKVWNIPYALITVFVNESIRIAYEAGYMQGHETDVTYHRGSYIKGIERAKELVDAEKLEDKPDNPCDESYMCAIEDCLSTLDDELKKL